MSGRVIHCCFDIDWVLRRGGAQELAGRVRLPQQEGERSTVAEIMAHAAILKARGFDAIPGCANHDAQGHCKGCER